ncbi:RimK family alpha-L-glutamate ligase [Kitasatospora sp. NPDC059571]|uniref:ATP-grasp domain-containing protein n=1 Tax=Kitasatospora sp. NPDC059571 TaxID=3346871 RepID=UPI0036BE2CC6
MSVPRRTVTLLTAAADHPLLAATAALLRAEGHRVEALHPAAAGPPAERPDVCLLKARTPQALALAGRLAGDGVPVVNSVEATAFCQDRLQMAEFARAVGLPFARTRAADLAELADRPFTDPLVVKSRHSRRQDLVAAVTSAERMRELADAWPGEPVVVQALAPNDGWDHKLWVVDGRIFAERRRSELAAPAADGPAGARRPLPVAELPAEWLELTLATGELFGLDVYGVDILAVEGAPLIVDINAFPGIRGQAGAPEALARLALATAAGAVTTATKDA